VDKLLQLPKVIASI